MKELILGGIRSGKSRLAEQAAIDSGLAVTYIATATLHGSDDDEMRQRITQHRNRRPASWALVEAPYALAKTVQQHASPTSCLLVDCLTLWLTNLLISEDRNQFKKERDAFIEIFPTLPGHIILVSNETNMGIIPMDKLSRKFCDEAGLLHQRLAQQSDRVVLAVAGLSHVIKNQKKPVPFA